MKSKLMTLVCVLAVSFGGVSRGFASDKDPLPVIADVVIVRPACFAVTVVGAAFFVVSLPFAAISKSVKTTADTLVVRPAKATFTRPVGDLEALAD